MKQTQGSCSVNLIGQRAEEINVIKVSKPQNLLPSALLQSSTFTFKEINENLPFGFILTLPDIICIVKWCVT